MAKQVDVHRWYEWIVDGLLLRAQKEHELVGGALEDEGTCNHVHTMSMSMYHVHTRVQPCAS